MADILNAPQQVGVRLAVQRRGVGQRRDVLADLLWVADVDFELDPLGLVQQLG